MIIVKDENLKKEKVGNVGYGIVFKLDGKYYQKIKHKHFEHPDYDVNKHRVVLDLEFNELCLIAVDTEVTIIDAMLVVSR